MGVHIVTDSSCDLPSAITTEHQIAVVPLTVRVNGKEYHEGVTLGAEDFVNELRQTSELPQTSQPSPQSFLNAYEHIARTAGSAAEVLCITLSSKLSGTFQSAMMAKKHFQGKVTVVDSLSGTLSLGIMALEAAQMAAAKLPMTEITKRLHSLREQASVLVGVDTLENAVKGGRVSRAQFAVAQILRMKFLLHTIEGEVEVCGRTRGRVNMLASFIDAMEAKMTSRGINYSEHTIGITHVGNESDAGSLADSIRQRFTPREILVAPMGSTIATYAGLGAIALAY